MAASNLTESKFSAREVLAEFQKRLQIPCNPTTCDAHADRSYSRVNCDEKSCPVTKTVREVALKADQEYQKVARIILCKSLPLQQMNEMNKKEVVDQSQVSHPLAFSKTAYFKTQKRYDTIVKGQRLQSDFSGSALQMSKVTGIVDWLLNNLEPIQKYKPRKQVIIRGFPYDDLPVLYHPTSKKLCFAMYKQSVDEINRTGWPIFNEILDILCPYKDKKLDGPNIIAARPDLERLAYI